jgi:hypothetical protein
LKHSQHDRQNQEGCDCENYAREKTLSACGAAYDFGSAPGTHSRAVGNRRLAVRARERFHGRIINARMFRTNNFSFGRVRLLNANA